MKTPFSTLGTALLLVIVVFSLGCSRIPDDEIRRLATTYRNKWIQTERPENSAKLQLGVIQSIERTKEGWRVTFVTETGHDEPTGMHDYFLHVLIDNQGKLIRIVRGPDRLS